MAPDSAYPNGLRERIAEIASRLNRHDDTFGRLWEAHGLTDRAVAVLDTELRQIKADIGEIKDSLQSATQRRWSTFLAFGLALVGPIIGGAMAIIFTGGGHP